MDSSSRFPWRRLQNTLIIPINTANEATVRLEMKDVLSGLALCIYLSNAASLHIINYSDNRYIHSHILL